MISLLIIKNLGIIRECQVEFHPGFNIITGESGSGKSLIIKAISLLRGERASKDLVHPLAQKAEVEALLEGPRGEVSVRRVIDKEGKSRVFIDGRLSTAKGLQELVAPLVEIQGQRETIKLLSPSYQLTVLDRLAEAQPLLDECAALWREYTQTQKLLFRFEREKEEAERKRDYLEFVVREIEEVAPKLEEEEELLKERETLISWETTREAYTEAAQLLSEGEVSAANLISEAIRALSRAGGQGADELINSLESALETVSDAAVKLSAEAERVEDAEERLNEVEARLSAYHRLKAKYGPTTADVLEFYARAKEELESLRSGAKSKKELEERLRKLEEKLTLKAEELERRRQEAACLLQQRVLSELSLLGFERPIFSVNLKRANMGPSGFNEVEFLFSANPDSPPLPLRKVASGGELSRLMLALKLVLADHEEQSTLIFDEVDTGIGGETALLVGERLKKLGEKKQVIAISHFPQVARFAHRHIKVEKALKEGKTFVKVRAVEGAEREMELKKMAGAVAKTRSEVAHGQDR